MDELQGRKDTETSYVRPDRMQATLHFILGFMFFMGCIMLLGGIAVFVLSFYSYGDTSGLGHSEDLIAGLYKHPLLLKFFLFFTSSLPFLLAAFITLQFIKATPQDYLLLHAPQSKKWFLYSLLFVVVCLPLMSPLLELNQLIDVSKWPKFEEWLVSQEKSSNATYEAMVGDRGTLSFLASLLFMAILPALAEEIFFRGFLMNVFNGMFKNMHVSILVTALIFSLIHFQFMKIVPMFFLATVFGYAVYWTSSLWTSIIAHFVNNALAVFMLYFYTEGDYGEVLSQGDKLPVFAGIAIAVIAMGLFIYLQKHSTTKTQNFYV